MFKSSENLRLAAEMRALQRVAAPWRESRSSWFDGTPDSIAARIAATDRVLAVARAGYTQAHIALEREASTARTELLAAKHRLLTDFLDDGARAFQGSKRVAGAHDTDPAAPWRNTMDDSPYRDLADTPDFGDLPLDGDYRGRHRDRDQAHSIGDLYDQGYSDEPFVNVSNGDGIYRNHPGPFDGENGYDPHEDPDFVPADYLGPAPYMGGEPGLHRRDF